MDGWNTNFLLGWPIFRGELLVSGSVIKHDQFTKLPMENRFFVGKNPNPFGGSSHIQTTNLPLVEPSNSSHK